MKSLDVTLTNRGTAAVSLLGMAIGENPEDFSLQLPAELTFPYSIPPGGQVIFAARYHPQLQPGDDYPYADTGTIRIQSTDKDAPEYDLPCTGNGVQPVLLVQPNPVDFGSTRVLGTMPATLTITHTGSKPDPARITLLDLTDDNAGNFEVQTKESTPKVLNPGDTTKVTLSYTPQAISAGDQGTFTIESEVASQEHMEVPLLGSSHAPQIELSTTALRFGTVSVGSNPSMTFKILSKGTDPLIIEKLELTQASSPKFELAPAAVADPIPAGGEQEIKVTYVADDRGDDDGRILIQSDDPLTRTVFVDLSGRTPSPEAQLTPEHVSFQLAGLSTTQAIDIKVYNTGDEVLAVTGCQFTNQDGTFSLDVEPSYPAQVQPGTELAGPYAIYTLRFTPTGPTVDDTCTLVIATDDPKNPELTVTGVGAYTP
jgi:hypothetical protein